MSPSSALGAIAIHRLPWWGWSIMAVVLLALIAFTVGLAYRQQGLRNLTAQVQLLRQQDRGVTPVDLLARAPSVDRSRQARAWSLLGTGAGQWNSPSKPISGLEALCLEARFHQERDRETARILQESLTKRQAWRELHRAGPVWLTAFGWLREDVPHPETASVAKMASVRIPSLLQVRNLAQALGAEARTSGDPRPALADLDALVDATRQGACLIDGMIHVALVQLRDEAWLEAIARGVDPQPWLESPMDARLVVAGSLGGERMLFAGSYVQGTLQGTETGSGWYVGGGASTWDSAGEWISLRSLWFLAPQDAAFLQSTLAAGEDSCRSGGSSPPKVPGELSRLLVLSRIALPDLLESIITAAQAEQAQRLHRLAARVILGWRAAGTLPAEAAHLDRACQALAASTAQLPGIRYERRSSTAFLLSTDPAPPATSMIPAGRIRALKPGPGAVYLNGKTSLYLDLGNLPPVTPPSPPAN